MPSSGLSAARLNPDPASTSPFDQLDPLRTRSTSGLSHMASNQALELVAQCNEVSRNLSMANQQAHKFRVEWDEWSGEETKPQDHEGQEEIFHDPAEQSTMMVPAEDPAIDRSGLQDRVFRSLIDLTPIQH